jgi:hypothetical protein
MDGGHAGNHAAKRPYVPGQSITRFLPPHGEPGRGRLRLAIQQQKRGIAMLNLVSAGRLALMQVNESPGSVPRGGKPAEPEADVVGAAVRPAEQAEYA